jgi:hypothetical protein
MNRTQSALQFKLAHKNITRWPVTVVCLRVHKRNPSPVPRHFLPPVLFYFLLFPFCTNHGLTPEAIDADTAGPVGGLAYHSLHRADRQNS